MWRAIIVNTAKLDYKSSLIDSQKLIYVCLERFSRTPRNANNPESSRKFAFLGVLVSLQFSLLDYRVRLCSTNVEVTRCKVKLVNNNAQFIASGALVHMKIYQWESLVWYSSE